MRPPLYLSSADNPRVKQVIHLRKGRDRRESGLFVAEGTREVSRALQAGLALKQLFFSPQMTGVDFAGLLALLPGIGMAQPAPTMFEVTPALLEKMAYCENPEGLLAVFEQPQWTLEGMELGENPLLLVAVETGKPGNLGAMARTAAAAGCAAVLAADADVDPFNPNAIRSSTGAVFFMPVITASSGQILGFLAERRVPLFAADPEAQKQYTQVNLAGPTAIAIGAEDQGLSEEWRRAAQESPGGGLVTIPMAGGPVDSLNASNAAAILLFEAVRQRQAR